MQASVIIPTRNSAHTLSGTLEHIRNGSRQPDEILIVDGCSVDDTTAIARRYGARVISNEQRYVAAARQIGVAAAHYEIIAFTDSDCHPAFDWLERIIQHFESDPALDGVGGKIVLLQPRNQVQAYSAYVFESILQVPDEPILVTHKKMAGSFAGANAAYRKATVLKVGGFREVFTNHAEDIDLFWRLVDQGAKLRFDPAVLVEHLGYATTLKQLFRTNFNYGIASTKLAKYHIGWQIDLKLYRLVGQSLLCLLNPWCDDPWAYLRCVQLMAFISGKVYSSIRYRTVNL
jgi:glycosyltransferase involved in cell wall biosynthesis